MAMHRQSFEDWERLSSNSRGLGNSSEGGDHFLVQNGWGMDIFNNSISCAHGYHVAVLPGRARGICVGGYVALYTTIHFKKGAEMQKKAIVVEMQQSIRTRGCYWWGRGNGVHPPRGYVATAPCTGYTQQFKTNHARSNGGMYCFRVQQSWEVGQSLECTGHQHGIE